MHLRRTALGGFCAMVAMAATAGPDGGSNTVSERGALRRWAYTAPTPRSRLLSVGGAADFESPEQRKERAALVDQHVGAMRAAMKANDWIKAGHEVQLALGLDPKRGDLIATAGQIFMRQGSFGLAAQCWLELIDAFPDDAALHSVLGGTYLYMGRTDDADRELDTALALNRGDPGARFYLAALRIRQQHEDRAVDALGTMKLTELWHATGSMIEEREPLVRTLTPDGYRALARALLNNATSAVPEEAMARIHTSTHGAIQAMAKSDWSHAAQNLRDAQRDGLRTPALLYNLALCAYKLEPTPERLAQVERVVTDAQGGATFARAYVYLCLGARDYARAQRGLGALAGETDDEKVLLEAALHAGQGELDAAWTIANAVPAKRRARMARWFESDIPAIEALRSSAGYDTWMPPPEAPRSATPDA